MDPARFVAVQREVFRRYAAGDYAGALAEIDAAAVRLDLPWTRVAWWRACLRARMGDLAGAVEVLEAAVEAGAWWSRSLLQRESDLEPLWGNARFRQLVDRCEQLRAAHAPGRPGLAVELPPGRGSHPLLLVLHGRAEMVEGTVGYWAPVGVAEGWAVAFPESTQRASIDGPVWDDPQLAVEEVTGQLAALWDDPRVVVDPCVIAGYSQGARRALQLGLELAPRFEGVVAVCPMLLRRDEIAEVLASLGDPPWPRLAVILGAEDPAFPAQRMAIDTLAAEGVEVDLQVVAGMGHYYPPDFPQRLRQALAFAGSRRV